MNDKTTLRQKILLVFLGLFLVAILIEIGLRFAGFMYLYLQEQRNRASLTQKDAYRILCLGESTTAFGEENSYPSQLEKILNQRFPQKRFSVINKGVPAINTTGILSQLKYNLDKYQPDMVIVMMGINDRESRFWQKDDSFQIKVLINSLRIYKLAKLLYKRTRQASILSQMYFERGQYANKLLNYTLAEEMFKKVIELSPKDARPYLQLGLCYAGQEKFVQSEEMFKKAVTINPGNADAYIYLGWSYSDSVKGNFDQAEEMFKKAVAINPESDKGYFQLGVYYKEQKKYPQAEEMFKKAIETSPDKEIAYIELGACYKDQGKFAQAEEMFKKAIELAPENHLTYIGLGWCYYAEGKFTQAEETLKEAVVVNPRDDIVYLELSDYYHRQRNYFLAQQVLQQLRANVRNTDDYTDITRSNYQKLKGIVLKRGIKLVCMQYPRRSIKPLKELLGSQEDLLYVDNEEVFREAIEKGKYEDYFEDYFGGDFGHCSPKGNQLLASHLADEILREYFAK